MRFQALAFATMAAVGTTAMGAVFTPYQTDFTGDNGTTPTDWVVGTRDSTGGSDQVRSSDIQNNALSFSFTQSTSGGNGNISGYGRLALDPTDPVANGTDFIISSTVTPTALTNTGGNKVTMAGLVALGNSNFANSDQLVGAAGEDYYWATMVLGHSGEPSIKSGDMRIYRADGGALAGSGTFDASAISLNAPLTFTLVGDYDADGQAPGSLKLTFTVSDGVTSATAELVDPSPLTGDYFGYRVRQAAGASFTTGIALDNFSIAAVPEPAALSLLAIGGLAMLRRRRA